MRFYLDDIKYQLCLSYHRNMESLFLCLLKHPGVWMPTSCISGGLVLSFFFLNVKQKSIHSCIQNDFTLQLRVWNPGESQGKTSSYWFIYFKIIYIYNCNYSSCCKTQRSCREKRAFFQTKHQVGGNTFVIKSALQLWVF